jgi:hypothetical protein
VEYFWLIALLGALGVLLVGGVMSFVNASRINGLERRARELESALRALEIRVHAPPSPAIPLSSRPERPEGAPAIPLSSRPERP